MFRSRGWVAGYVVAAVTALLVVPGAAMAQIPTLQSVSQQDRHVSIAFSAPSADFVSVTVASAPDQGSDGAFYSENIAASAILTDDEIASGSWLSDAQLDPGQYWVNVNATPDFSACLLNDGTMNPTCADGYSNVLSVTVPTPTVRYRASVSEMLTYIGQVDLKLTATPLGANETARLCYSIKRHGRSSKRCLNQNLVGYDWNASASDLVDLSTRGMSGREHFTWSMSGRVIATLTVTIPKGAR